jgi:hypothetical protein
MGRATPHARQLRSVRSSLLAADRSQYRYRMLTHRDRNHLARAKELCRDVPGAVWTGHAWRPAPDPDGMQRRAIAPNHGPVTLNRRAHHS